MSTYVILAKPRGFSGYGPGSLILSYCFPDKPGWFSFCAPDLFPPVSFSSLSEAQDFITATRDHFFYFDIFLGYLI